MLSELPLPFQIGIKSYTITKFNKYANSNQNFKGHFFNVQRNYIKLCEIVQPFGTFQQYFVSIGYYFINRKCNGLQYSHENLYYTDSIGSTLKMCYHKERLWNIDAQTMDHIVNASKPCAVFSIKGN